MDPVKITFKNNSITNFLKSISAFNDRVILDEIDNKLVATTATNECVYRGYYNAIQFDKKNNDDVVKLNIPEIKKLTKFFESLPEDNISLKYDNNKLIYSSKYLKLKYHLLSDGIINECKLNIDRALKLNFDIEFDLQRSDISNIIKMLSYNNIESKLYFYVENNNLYCDIADKTKTNTDELSLCIKENVSFNFNGLIIPAETFRILNTTLFDSINIKLNTDKYIMLATIAEKDYTIHYIISGREK